MSCQMEIPSFGQKMQGEQFNFKMRLMKVGGSDMILGMDWIDMITLVILHTRPHSLSFMIEERMVTFYGITEDPDIFPVDIKALKRMLQCGTCVVITEVVMVEAQEISSDKGEIHPNIEKLLEKHSMVF